MRPTRITWLALLYPVLLVSWSDKSSDTSSPPIAKDSDSGGQDSAIDSGPFDFDGDGYPAGEDCIDWDAEVNPGAEEVPYDRKDNDCNPDTPDDDIDRDGFDSFSDCDDNDPALNPQAVDICGDDIDQNCSGADKPCGIFGHQDYQDADAWSIQRGGVCGHRVIPDVNRDGSDDLLISTGNVVWGNIIAGIVYTSPLEGPLNREDAVAVISHYDYYPYVICEVPEPLPDITGDGYPEVVVGWDIYPHYYADLAEVYFYSGPINRSFGHGSHQRDPDIILHFPLSFYGENPPGVLPDFNQTSENALIIDSWDGIYLFQAGSLSANTYETDAEAHVWSTGIYPVQPGDVTGDGISDLITTDVTYDADRGIIRVYQGPLEGDVSEETDIAITGDNRDSALQGDYGTAGDFNKDGYADLVAMDYGSRRNEPDNIYLFLGPFTKDRVAAEADSKFIFELKDESSYKYATSGDINADDQLDLVFSGTFDDKGHGSVLMLGPFEGTYNSQSDNVVAFFNRSYHPDATGDFNGDGFSDIAFNNNGGVFLFNGSDW
jgi:hypothetical protein